MLFRSQKLQAGREMTIDPNEMPFDTLVKNVDTFQKSLGQREGTSITLTDANTHPN